MYDHEQSQDPPSVGDNGSDIVLLVRFIGVERNDPEPRSNRGGPSDPHHHVDGGGWQGFETIAAHWWEIVVFVIVLTIAYLSYVAQIPQLPDFSVETRVIGAGAPP